MDSQPPVLEQFNTLLSSSEVLFVVFYRGHWCPFCQTYLTTLTQLSPSIKAANGTPLIVTSEATEYLDATRQASGYTGAAIVDTENFLAKEFQARGWINIAITERKGYAHGMAQPAVLVLKKDGTILEKWAIVPSMMNMGGASDRPSLTQIWENTQAKLNNKKPVHQMYKKLGSLGVLKAKIFS
ncbi:hypothetical protein BGZ60DRAFT_40918 [Tricladium varicosporioides]|nr:hypothetical protein BGZ60DRAFT_40918 [Hymenoscyphus varicosporioides]